MKLSNKTKIKLALLALKRSKQTRPQSALEFKLQERKKFGYHYTLIRDFRINNRHEKFRFVFVNCYDKFSNNKTNSNLRNFFRMSMASFDELLSLVREKITKVEYLREPISPEERLEITLK
jgi:hypothetical protein